MSNAAKAGQPLKVRAEQAAPVPAESTRSLESVRAEQAHRALVAKPRPLTKARSEFARRFDAVMHAHWVRGEEAFSNVAVARACGVDEKAVRQWRLGEKRIPPEAMALFPSQLFDETVSVLEALRSRTPKRAVSELGKALSNLDTQILHEDPTEMLRALVEARSKIDALMKKAMG